MHGRMRIENLTQCKPGLVTILPASLCGSPDYLVPLDTHAYVYVEAIASHLHKGAMPALFF
jgi:hypothetical protein